MDPVSSVNLIATFQFLGNLKKTMAEARKDSGRDRKDNGQGQLTNSGRCQERQWPRPGKNIPQWPSPEKTMGEARKDNGRGQERQWTRSKKEKTMAEARNENVVR